MSMEREFCVEKIDAYGALKKLELQYPRNFNFGYDVVDVIAARTPQKKALVWCNAEGEEHIFTFEDIRRFSNRMAHVFQKAGIQRGDRVMVVLKRHYEYWFAAIALHKLGAVMIPATHMLTVSDFAYRMESARMRGIICTPQNDVPRKIREALARTGLAAKLWTVRQDVEGFDNMSKAMNEESAESEVFARAETSVEDPMLLYFTSGTTGEPKGVIHDFAYPLAHIVTAKYWQQATDGGLHFTVAETGWAKASWGKLYGQWLGGGAGGRGGGGGRRPPAALRQRRTA